MDAHYRRLDFSEQLAFKARVAFARNITRGEAGMNLAEAALQVAAEDDAIASSSTVPFPVESYLQRIARLAEEVAAQHRSVTSSGDATGDTSTRSSTSSSSGGGSATGLAAMAPADAVAAVEEFLFVQQRFKPAPAGGRSALPPRTLLTHPGVYESPVVAYLNEVLVRRAGHTAALAIILHDVLQRLLVSGDLDFASLVSPPPGWAGAPRAEPLANLTRAVVLDPSRPGAVLNACSSEVLVELLRHLKRSLWPFPWDTSVDVANCSHGGFRGAAKAALGSDEVSAEVRAISATAAHRLQRGIFTSPGAGDLRRCILSAERLVMLLGDEQPRERRDLGVLYLHAGLFNEAAAELSEYLRRTTTSTGRRRLREPSSSAAAAAAGGDEDPFDLRLARLLLDLATSGGSPGGSDAAAAAGSGGGERPPLQRTLLAPGAAGGAAVPLDDSAAASDQEQQKQQQQQGQDVQQQSSVAAAPLMSIALFLGADQRGGDESGGGLLGAGGRSKLPLTW